MRNTVFAVLLAVPTLVFAASPPEGVALKVRRGFFTETDIGTLFTVGGHDGYSNAQTYLQVGIGLDITRYFELGVHFGLGANAYNCFVERDNGVCPTSESFTLTFFDATLAYLFPLAERLYLTPKIAAGYTMLDPAPALTASGNGFTRGVNVGGGVGIEYATAMDHFTIGADLLVRYIPVAGIPAVTLFPRVKYTF